MLTVELPEPLCPALTHCAGIIFGDWLGLPYRVVGGEGHVCRVRLAGAQGALAMPAGYRPGNCLQVPRVRKRYDLPTTVTNAAEANAGVLLNDLPILSWAAEAAPAGRRGGDDGETYLPADVVGAACFMLTRQEELESSIRDSHERFPAEASFACRAGFLERPIVDEYVEVLWAAIKAIWPRLERKPRDRKMRVTCDVDSPCQVDYRLKSLVKDALKAVSPWQEKYTATQRFVSKWHARSGRCDSDPHYKMFDWMMDVNERAGNRMTFYFLAGGRDLRDGRYKLNDRGIRKLIRRIHGRGHEIGLHPSYGTFRDSGAILREADELRHSLAKAGIETEPLGSRQHYLRWDPECTARNLEAAGLAYDSSLGYADRPGFRCGTSRDFRMFDVKAGRPMNLVQRPLVLMECTVLGSHYMAMDYDDQTLAYMQGLKEQALSVGGQFTLLWHNSYFEHPLAKPFYEALIS